MICGVLVWAIKYISRWTGNRFLTALNLDQIIKPLTSRYRESIVCASFDRENIGNPLYVLLLTGKISGINCMCFYWQGIYRESIVCASIDREDIRNPLYVLLLTGKTSGIHCMCFYWQGRYQESIVCVSIDREERECYCMCFYWQGRRGMLLYVFLLTGKKGNVQTQG